MKFDSFSNGRSITGEKLSLPIASRKNQYFPNIDGRRKKLLKYAKAVRTGEDNRRSIVRVLIG
jgi:hypothetical protein